MTIAVQRQAVLAAIARREWLRRMLTLAAAGCGRPNNRAQATHSAITVLTYGDEEALSPFSFHTAQFLVFLPLVARSATGELEGRLARSWEHSPDYHTWTVHLRTDVRWHDGVPVTAHDIKFTMDLLSHPDVALETPGAYSIAVLDDSTYTVTYKIRPRVSFPDDWMVYYPKHLLETLDPKQCRRWDFWTHPVGNGPFRYVRTVPKTMIELEANPDYYRGKPRIQQIVVKFGESSLTEILSGSVDVGSVATVDLLKMRGDPRFQVYDHTAPIAPRAILWNQRNPLFRDPKIRRALTLGINRRELHQLHNYPVDTPIFDVIFTLEQFRRGELLEPVPYDPERAKQLLDEAGWRDRNGDGVRDRDGKTFRFTALVPLPPDARSAVYIQAQLRRLGILMDFQTMDDAAARQRVKAGEFEAAILIVRSMLDASDGHRAWFGEGSPLGYTNPTVLALFAKARASMDPNETDRIYRELMPIFQADLPVTFLYPGGGYTTVAHRRVRGLSSPYRTDPFEHLEELWLED